MRIAWLGLIATGFLHAEEAAREAAVVELRQTISGIVEVKGRASRERTDWQARKAEMGALLELHRRELELLSEELEKAGGSAEGYDRKKRTAEAELERLKRARSAAREAVAANRGRALALAEQFPAPLREETKPERSSLENWTPDDDAREGLQALLGLVAKAEQFNRRVTRVTDERNGREVEVIYIGLARAYYADRSGNAGFGVPGPEGWVWTAKEDLNEEVVMALDELDRKRPPELVELPLQISEVER